MHSRRPILANQIQAQRICLRSTNAHRMIWPLNCKSRRNSLSMQQFWPNLIANAIQSATASWNGSAVGSLNAAQERRCSAMNGPTDTMVRLTGSRDSALGKLKFGFVDRLDLSQHPGNQGRQKGAELIPTMPRRAYGNQDARRVVMEQRYRSREGVGRSPRHTSRCTPQVVHRIGHTRDDFVPVRANAAQDHVLFFCIARPTRA